MVSALSRKTSIASEKQYDPFTGDITKAPAYSVLNNKKAKSYPCALRDFINSNADLPTIEELAEKSPIMARVMGIAS